MMKVVFDLGNGYGKLVTPSGLAVAPSWIAPVVDRSQAGGSRVIEYVSGLNPHLKYGAMFAGGADAQTYLSKASQRVGDFADSAGKSKLGLQLLTSMLPASNQTIEELIISCPDLDVHAPAIKQAFVGRHDLRCNGQGYSINIGTVNVVNEGLGIAAYTLQTGQVKDASGYIVAIDVGFQTAIMSAYTSDGKEITSLRHVSQMGASTLYQAVASDIEMRKMLGRAPKISLIEAAFHDPCRRYGKGIDAPQIDAICRRHHEPWLSQMFTPMFEKLKNESDETSAITFGGGGANLTKPLHSISSKVCLIDRPQDANALGLAMIAGINISQLIAA
jgi:hypothetical protein